MVVLLVATHLRRVQISRILRDHNASGEDSFVKNLVLESIAPAAMIILLVSIL